MNLPELQAELQESGDPTLQNRLDTLFYNQAEQERERQELGEIYIFERLVQDAPAKREIAQGIATLLSGQEIPDEASLFAAEALSKAYQQSGVAQVEAIEKAVGGLQTLTGKLAQVSAAKLQRQSEFTYSDSIYDVITEYLLKLRRIRQLLEQMRKSKFDEDVPSEVNKLVANFQLALGDFISAGKLTDPTSEALAACTSRIKEISFQISEGDGARATIEQKIRDMDQSLKLVMEFVAAKSGFDLIRRGENEYDLLVMHNNALNSSAYLSTEQDVARLTNIVKDVSQGNMEKAVLDLGLLQRSFSRKKTAWQKLQSLSQSKNLLLYLDNFTGTVTESAAILRVIADLETRLLGPKEAIGKYAMEVLLEECIADPEKLTQERLNSMSPQKLAADTMGAQ